MKEIETIYKGYRFRSREKARWAVFFDTLGVTWKYEDQEYDVCGTRHLPDFWLPEHQYFIEIQEKKPTREESIQTSLLAITQNHPVFTFYDGMWIPGVDETKTNDWKSEGAEGYTPDVARLEGQDTTSPCYQQKCVHTIANSVYREYGHTCPYTHSIDNIGDEGKFVQAMYTAAIQQQSDDTYKIQRGQDGKLHYLAPWKTMGNDKQFYAIGYREMEIPPVIQEVSEAFTNLLARFSAHWIWGICATWDVIDPYLPYRWCQCAYCGKVGIAHEGEERFLPCHTEHRREQRYEYHVMPERDRTPALITAYMAARQARFEDENEV